jgi:multidrug efflux pump
MKKFTDIFIKRPVLASAISFALLIFGIWSYHVLPHRLYPKLVSPVLTISTNYPGASAEMINSSVTNLLQNSLSGIENVNYITASSSQNSSVITINLQLGVDPLKILNVVITKLAAVTDQLPKNCDKPIITVGDSNSDPVMILAVTSEHLTRRDVADYLRQVIAPTFAAIDGVAQANILGRNKAMRLWFDPFKMAARNLSPTDVFTNIKINNAIAAAGQTDNQASYFNITANTDLHTPDQFKKLLIKKNDQRQVLLEDIAKIEVGDKSTAISAFYNNSPATMIFIQLAPGANPMAVTDQIKKVLPKINLSLPFDLAIHNVVDSGKYMHAAMHEIYLTLFITTLIVIAVVFVFLGSMRMMLIPVITIPLSLFGVCIFLGLLKFTLNSLTLLAMVLAVGLVVDDAIVIVENIYRHYENGLSAFNAAIIGAREVAGPIVAMSIVLAAVYLPLGLTTGLTGQLFKEFAFTLAGCVIISGIISLTLSPLLCRLWLKKTAFNNSLYQLLDFYLKYLSYLYKKYLRLALNNSRKVILVWVVFLIGIVLLLNIIPQQLAPVEDQGLLIALSNAPDYTNAKFLNYYTGDLINSLRKVPDSDSAITVTGIPTSHSALSFISLKDWQQRKKSALSIQSNLQQMVNQIPGLAINIIMPPSLPGPSGLPLQIILKSTSSYESLSAATNAILAQAWGSGLFEFVQSDLKYDSPNATLDINKNIARTLGISMAQIADALSLLLSEKPIQQYVQLAHSYFVIPELNSEARSNPQNLLQINLRSQSGQLVPLGNFATLKVKASPEHYNQFQQLNSITITGMMSHNQTLAAGIVFFQNAVKKVNLPALSIDYAGETRQFLQAKGQMAGIFVSALLCIFLILAVTFECYRSPLIIILGSAPLAIFSACLPLYFGWGDLNIYTEIGLLTLVGLICKHGILITEYANQLQSTGLSVRRAVLKAATLRFRPILMTTAAMCFGVLPLVCATGAGAASRNQLGIVLGCGMLLGTLLTLFILPVIYQLLMPSVPPK